MKANQGQITRTLDAAGEAVRCFLLYGPDDAGSRALTARLERALGANAERIDLDGATLASDPARLSDEAAAISLFGDQRWIRVTGGEECCEAVSALLDAGVAGNPVVVIAGALKPTSPLLKRVLSANDAMAFASFRAEGEKAAELVLAIARPMGLRVAPHVADAIVIATGGNRAIIERELEKIATYLDAAPDRPREAKIETMEAVGAEFAEADTSALVDAVFDGDTENASREWATRGSEATSAVPVLRAIARRTLLLSRLRTEVECGRSPASVISSAGKSLFYKEKDAVARQLGRWSSNRLSSVAARIMDVEARLKHARSAGEVLAAEEVLTIARVARSLR